MKYKITLGDNIKMFRCDKGLPQNRVAMEVGISPSYLCKVENNKGSLLFEEVEALAAFFEKPIGDFATRYTNEPPMVPLRPK
jgi:transcriptional regulator with XRE-family HTH domain